MSCPGYLTQQTQGTCVIEERVDIHETSIIQQQFGNCVDQSKDFLNYACHSNSSLIGMAMSAKGIFTCYEILKKLSKMRC